jgi:hypothetical protein
VLHRQDAALDLDEAVGRHLVVREDLPVRRQGRLGEDDRLHLLQARACHDQDRLRLEVELLGDLAVVLHAFIHGASLGAAQVRSRRPAL